MEFGIRYLGLCFKGLNHPYMNKAFSHNVSRFCFRCLSLFICHFCITTGLFVEWGRRIEKKSGPLFIISLCEFVSFQEDTNLISHSEIPVLGIRFRRYRVASADFVD